MNGSRAVFVSPIRFPQTVGNYPSGALARAYGVLGPNMTLASGDASGLDAMAEACGLLRRGETDIVLAGGADTVSTEMAEGLSDGDAVISEGACFFVMEAADHASQRQASVLATITSIRREADGADDACQGISATVVASNAASQPVTIQVERVVGRCLAALGPACVAAAIGVATGHSGSFVGAGGETGDSVVAVGAHRICVSGSAEGGQRIVIELVSAADS